MQSLTSADADRALLTQAQMEDELVMMMAGSASEELRYGDHSTSGEDDIQKASELARQMVGRYGMSAKLGPVRLMGSELDFYLTGDSSALTSMSPETMREFDLEVKRLTETAKARASQALRFYAKPLANLADALLSHENLEGPELEKLLAITKPRSNGKADVVAKKPAAKRPTTASR